MTLIPLLAIAFLSALISFFVATHSVKQVNTNPGRIDPPGHVYQHVMTTKTLRCGYFLWPPLLSQDVNTGKLSGFFYDYMEELGKSLGIKIAWVAEIPISDAAAALNSGRIDAYCVALGAVPARTVAMNMSKPFMFYTFYPYARADDRRFDNDLTRIDDPSITLSTMEGEYTSILARTSFPKARLMEITGNQGSSSLFLNVANKKADVVFQDSAAFRDYDRGNPRQLRLIPGGAVGFVPGGIPMKYGEDELKRLFDYGIDDLQSRFIDKRLAKRYGFDQTHDILLPASAVETPIVKEDSRSYKD